MSRVHKNQSFDFTVEAESESESRALGRLQAQCRVHCSWHHGTSHSAHGAGLSAAVSPPMTDDRKVNIEP